MMLISPGRAGSMTGRNSKTATGQREHNNVMVSFLRAGELFQGVSETDAQKISGLCAERRYPQGTTIFAEGDTTDAVYILKQGLVKIISISERGMETILHILKPDEMFGSLLLAEEKRPFTAIAMDDIAVTVISRENFLLLLSSVPTLGLNFARLLSRRLQKAEKQLAEFSHTWSYHRLAKVLLELSERHGEEAPTGTLITLRLTHEDLANRIGTTRETVTTQLNKFERMGLLSREDRHLIVQKHRLAEFLRSEEMRLGPF